MIYYIRTGTMAWRLLNGLGNTTNNYMMFVTELPVAYTVADAATGPCKDYMYFWLPQKAMPYKVVGFMAKDVFVTPEWSDT